MFAKFDPAHEQQGLSDFHGAFSGWPSVLLQTISVRLEISRSPGVLSRKAAS
jgi:hypothetical protein